MSVVIRGLAGFLLLAHGLVHLLYLAPDADDPDYPFTLRRSWIVPSRARRPVAVALIAATVTAFALLALAVWGVPGLASVWEALAIVAASSSVLLMLAFWDVRLGTGMLIDLVLVAVVLVHPAWTDGLSG